MIKNNKQKEKTERERMRQKKQRAPSGPAPLAVPEKQTGRSQWKGLLSRTAQICIRLPPTSFPLPELFIIEELLEMECELGAQLDFVLSCSPHHHPTPQKVPPEWGGAGVCRALL